MRKKERFDAVASPGAFRTSRAEKDDIPLKKKHGRGIEEKACPGSLAVCPARRYNKSEQPKRKTTDIAVSKG